MLKFVATVLGVLAVFIPAVAYATTATIKGTVTYRERIALPPGASVEVRLVDVSRADMAATTLAETKFIPQGQVPIPFELSYDRSAIIEKNTYALQASISIDGKLWFTTATHHPFDPEGTENQEIILTRASNPTPAGSWVAERIRESDVRKNVDSVLDLAEDGTLSGTGGCNRMFGKAEISGTGIQFGSIASTQMACPQDEMDQERKFFDALADVRHWRMDPTGTKLMLLDEKDALIVVLGRK